MISERYYGVVATALVSLDSLDTITCSSLEDLNVLDLISTFSVTTKSETKSCSLLQEVLKPIVSKNRIERTLVVMFERIFK